MLAVIPFVNVSIYYLPVHNQNSAFQKKSNEFA